MQLLLKTLKPIYGVAWRSVAHLGSIPFTGNMALQGYGRPILGMECCWYLLA